MPDLLCTPFEELQTRAGLPSIDDALAERSALVSEWANHAALYDSFGLYEAERKRRLAIAALQVRHAKDSAGQKTTEKMVEDEAHSWPAYQLFITESIRGKAEWLVAKDRIDAITQRIQRANILGRFAASERAGG
jgi:hypothetical protein